MSNVWEIVLLVIAIAYAGLYLFGLFFSHRLIFEPSESKYESFPDQVILPSVIGDEITAFYAPCEGARYTLLYSHGNAEDLSDVRERVAEFQAHGLSVFAYDYPGYGTSSGKPSEAGCYAAINAAYVYLKTFLDTPAERIILYGRSLGGGPSIDLASREPVAGVITEGTFTSTFRVKTIKKIIPLDCFDSLAKVHRITAPKLLVHGEEDETIPLAHGKTLYQKAIEPKEKLWLPGVGHNDVLTEGGEQYWQAVDQFIESLPRAD